MNTACANDAAKVIKTWGTKSFWVENKMKGHLTSREKSLLIISLQNHAPELVNKVSIIEQLDSEEINKMRDALGDELVTNGLKEDYEPNIYGIELEDLNGKLAELYIWPKEKKA